LTTSTGQHDNYGTSECDGHVRASFLAADDPGTIAECIGLGAPLQCFYQFVVPIDTLRQGRSGGCDTLEAQQKQQNKDCFGAFKQEM